MNDHHDDEVEARLRRTLAARGEDMAAADGAGWDPEASAGLLLSLSVSDRTPEPGRAGAARWRRRPALVAAASVLVAGFGAVGYGVAAAGGNDPAPVAATDDCPPSTITLPPTTEPPPASTEVPQPSSGGEAVRLLPQAQLAVAEAQALSELDGVDAEALAQAVAEAEQALAEAEAALTDVAARAGAGGPCNEPPPPTVTVPPTTTPAPPSTVTVPPPTTTPPPTVTLPPTTTPPPPTTRP